MSQKSRQQTYKSRNLRPDELRRQREDQNVEIRKTKREESLAKRRNFATEKQGETSEEEEEDEEERGGAGGNEMMEGNHNINNGAITGRKKTPDRELVK